MHTGLALCFVAIVLGVAIALVLGTRAAALRAELRPDEANALATRLALGIAGWAALITTVARSGVLSSFDARPPRLMFVVGAAMALFVYTTRRSVVPRLLDAAPRTWLVALQSMRAAIELVLWGLFATGSFPIHLTFEGRNFDVLVGLSAPVVAYAVARGRLGSRGLVAWNVVSLGLLANIVFMAVTTLPGPLHLSWPGVPSTVVTTVPYVLLPGFLVPVALFGHVLSLRQVWTRHRPVVVSAEAQQIGGGL